MLIRAFMRKQMCRSSLRLRWSKCEERICGVWNRNDLILPVLDFIIPSQDCLGHRSSSGRLMLVLGHGLARADYSMACHPLTIISSRKLLVLSVLQQMLDRASVVARWAAMVD